MATSEPAMEGYLTKLGAFVKNWKRRWFVLQGTTLRYYKEKGDAEPRGTVDVTTATIRKSQQRSLKGHHVFELVTKERVYYLAGETLEMMIDWMIAVFVAQGKSQQEITDLVTDIIYVFSTIKSGDMQSVTSNASAYTVTSMQSTHTHATGSTKASIAKAVDHRLAKGTETSKRLQPRLLENSDKSIDIHRTGVLHHDAVTEGVRRLSFSSVQSYNTMDEMMSEQGGLPPPPTAASGASNTIQSTASMASYSGVSEASQMTTQSMASYNSDASKYTRDPKLTLQSKETAKTVSSGSVASMSQKTMSSAASMPSARSGSSKGSKGSRRSNGSSKRGGGGFRRPKQPSDSGKSDGSDGMRTVQSNLSYGSSTRASVRSGASTGTTKTTASNASMDGGSSVGASSTGSYRTTKSNQTYASSTAGSKRSAMASDRSSRGSGASRNGSDNTSYGESLKSDSTTQPLFDGSGGGASSGQVSASLIVNRGRDVPLSLKTAGTKGSAVTVSSAGVPSNLPVVSATLKGQMADGVVGQRLTKRTHTNVSAVKAKSLSETPYQEVHVVPYGDQQQVEEPPTASIYTKHFAPPRYVVSDVLSNLSEAKRRKDKDINVQVYAYEGRVRGTNKTFWALRTCGVASRRMHIDVGINLSEDELKRYGRVELVLYVDTPLDHHFAWLQWLGHFPFEENTFLGVGHTVMGGKSLFRQDSELMHFFFLPSIVKQDQQLDATINGDQVSMLWVVPVTDAERKYKLENGWARMLDLFEANNHPFILDEKRASYV